MGNAGSVKRHLENAERTGVFQLTKSNLTEFPKDIVRLKSVRSLDLSENKIKAVPALIGEFNQLKHFSMNTNRLNQLPPETGSLKKLETLSLNKNLLFFLPNSMAQLSALRSLSLCDNLFTAFPLVVCELSHLDVLDLSRNKIQEIPDGVEALQVSELNLNLNQISTISTALSACSRLKVLRLEENCLHITSIPPKVLRESQISLLAVDGNLFEMKDFHNIEGYEQYMERYTATKKKII